MARFSREAISIVPPGGQRAAISGLPLSALRLEERIVSGLKVLGFRSIGELAEAPRAPLTLRFGPELVRRLSQALGEIGEPIEPVRVAELVEVRRAFPEPIAAAETIARYSQKLVIGLAPRWKSAALAPAVSIWCCTGWIAACRRCGPAPPDRCAMSNSLSGF